MELPRCEFYELAEHDECNFYSHKVTSMTKGRLQKKKKKS